MDGLVITIFVGLAVAGIITTIYNHTSHSKTNGKTLRKDALISDIETANVGGRKALTAAIRTTVTFDDGFIYISHKSKTRMQSPTYLRGTISVDSEVIEEIKKDAIAAHKKAYDEQSLGNSYEPIKNNQCESKKEDAQYSFSKSVPNSTAQLSLEDYRKEHIIETFGMVQTVMISLHLQEDFVNIKNDVILSIHKDLLAYESLLGMRLYTDTSENAKCIFDRVTDKAVGLSVYTCLFKNNFNHDQPSVIINYISDILISEFYATYTEVFDMSKKELKDFLAQEIIKRIAKEKA